MDEREEKSIDFVLRAIETRLAQRRGVVWSPETDSSTSHNARIDAVAIIGDQSFAVEHTMIEPYEGHHKHGILTRKAEADFLDILDKVDLNIGVDIALPSNWVEVLPRQKQRKRFLTSLASLFRSNLNEIKELEDDNRFFRIGEINRIGIEVVRNGFEELDGEDVNPCFVLLAGDYKNGRAGRITRALDDKIPKLHNWKADHKTVLILENRDISLTSWRSVRSALENIWVDISDIPIDYLFVLVQTSSDTAPNFSELNWERRAH